MKIKDNVLLVVCFLVSHIVCWTIIWLGGYNFDNRTIWVAYAEIVILILNFCLYQAMKDD